MSGVRSHTLTGKVTYDTSRMQKIIENLSRKLNIKTKDFHGIFFVTIIHTPNVGSKTKKIIEKRPPSRLSRSPDYLYQKTC